MNICHFSVQTNTVQLALNQVMFTDNRKPIGRMFRRHLTDDYKADHVKVDFSDLATAFYTINDYVANKTNQRIQRVVNYKDLQNPSLMLISAIYFKGQWSVGIVSFVIAHEFINTINYSPLSSSCRLTAVSLALRTFTMNPAR